MPTKPVAPVRKTGGVSMSEWCPCSTCWNMDRRYVSAGREPAFRDGPLVEVRDVLFEYPHGGVAGHRRAVAGDDYRRLRYQAAQALERCAVKRLVGPGRQLDVGDIVAAHQHATPAREQ